MGRCRQLTQPQTSAIPLRQLRPWDECRSHWFYEAAPDGRWQLQQDLRDALHHEIFKIASCGRGFHGDPNGYTRGRIALRRP